MVLDGGPENGLVGYVSNDVGNNGINPEMEAIKGEMRALREEVLNLTTTMSSVCSKVESLTNVLIRYIDNGDSCKSNAEKGLSHKNNRKRKGYVNSAYYGSEGNENTFGREGKYMNRRRTMQESAATMMRPMIAKLLHEQSLINKRIMPTYKVGPFLLDHERSREDVMMVEYIFNNNLNPSELVVQMKYNELTRQTIKVLMPKLWLDDNIMDIVCEMRTNDVKVAGDKAKIQGYVPPLYTQIVMGRSLDWIHRVHVHHLKERYMSTMMSCSKIFFPMLDGPGRHWFLMVVDVCRGKAEIWDSLQKEHRREFRISMCHAVLKSLDVMFEKEIKDQVSRPFPFFGTFTVVERIDAPQQQNNYDCGVYVITYMLRPASVTCPEFKFNLDEQRCDLTLEIVKSWMNGCSDTLAKLAEEFSLVGKRV